MRHESSRSALRPRLHRGHPRGDGGGPRACLGQDRPWELVGRIDPALAYARLAGHLTRGPKLLGNRGKAMPNEVAEKGVEASLALVEPGEHPTFRAEVSTGGRLSPRVEFSLRGQAYDLGITDFAIGPALRRLGEGSHTIEELGFEPPRQVLLTVSLGEPLDDWRWKLVAAVLFLP